MNNAGKKNWKTQQGENEEDKSPSLSRYQAKHADGQNAIQMLNSLMVKCF